MLCRIPLLALSALLFGAAIASAQQTLSREEVSAIARDFFELLPNAHSSWRRCANFAEYSDPAVVEIDVQGNLAKLKIRVKARNLSADFSRNPALVDCFGGQKPARGETVDVVLLATYRKTASGWELD